MIMLVAVFLQSVAPAIDPAEAKRLCPAAYDVENCMAARQAFQDASLAVRQCRGKVARTFPRAELVDARVLNETCEAEQYRCVGAFFRRVNAQSKDADPKYTDAQIVATYAIGRDECYFNWKNAYSS